MYRDESNLFEAEERIAETSAENCSGKKFIDSPLLSEYRKLTINYEKLLRQNNKLTRLNAKQRKKIHKMKTDLNEREGVMNRDLLLAKEIQEQFLPDGRQEILGCIFHSVYIPMDTIGGDFFDFIKLDDEKIGIFISDVSGHGISAALITAMIKANLHHENQILKHPIDFLLELQHKMVPLLIDKYFTAFYGVLDVKEKTFTFSNCAHLKQLVLKKQTGRVEGMHLRGPIIGICPFPKECFLEKTIELEKGDRLYFYTDGIVEVFNGERSLSSQFGPEGIAEVIANCKDASPAKQIEQIIAGAQKFQNKKEFNDDIAIIVVEIE